MKTIRICAAVTLCIVLTLGGYRGFGWELRANSTGIEEITPSGVTKTDVYGNVLTNEFFYWRNTLNTAEKAVYDKIYARALALETAVELDKSETIDADRVLDVLEAVRYDNPEIFWLDYSIQYYYNNRNVVTSLELSFIPDKSLVSAYRAVFDACADSTLVYVAGLSTDIEKVKYIHDLLTNINDYDIDAQMDQNAYSGVAGGQAVCMGYASAFQYFMQRLGIPCAIIIGTADGAELHAWNLLKLDGEYYNIDVTWDDPNGNPPTRYYYNYFNITDIKISADHMRSSPCDKFPVAEGTKYSFDNYFGTKQGVGSNAGSDFTRITYGTPVEPPLRKLENSAIGDIVLNEQSSVVSSSAAEAARWSDYYKELYEGKDRDDSHLNYIKSAISGYDEWFMEWYQRHMK